ncbi:MAG: hypothetical protein EAZ07_00525 [Cytophagales bacterium]|nr:MAG: hypothetical protein EAZ07_00525 [Cytophagales bacterium]
MKLIKYTPAILLSFLGIMACQKLFIAPDEVANQPVRNFELFWNDVDKTYPFFKEDNIDWQSYYDKYRPLVNEKTQTEALFGIFIRMMQPLMDGHRSLSYQDLAWSEPPKYSPRSKYNFDFISSEYLTSVNVTTQPDEFDPEEQDTVLITAMAKNNQFAYIGLRSYNTEIELNRSVEEFLSANSSVNNLIIDLRRNGGGFLFQMFQLMRLFARTKVPYATYVPKVGPLKNHLFPREKYEGEDFIIPSDIKVPSDGRFSNKRIVFITNRVCYSAAEHTVLVAKQLGFPVVGDSTGGALSIVMEKTLPNGINYVLVNSKTLDINGRLWERIGVPPTHYVKATQDDFKNGDPFFEKAIQLLGNN